MFFLNRGNVYYYSYYSHFFRKMILPLPSLFGSVYGELLMFYSENDFVILFFVNASPYKRIFACREMMLKKKKRQNQQPLFLAVIFFACVGFWPPFFGEKPTKLCCGLDEMKITSFGYGFDFRNMFRYWFPHCGHP